VDNAGDCCPEGLSCRKTIHQPPDRTVDRETIAYFEADEGSRARGNRRHAIHRSSEKIICVPGNALHLLDSYTVLLEPGLDERITCAPS